MPKPAAPCRLDARTVNSALHLQPLGTLLSLLLLLKIAVHTRSTASHKQPRCSCNLQLAFMPPEAFDDDAEKLSEKLDVYSMGVCGERGGSALGREEFVGGGKPPFRANAVVAEEGSHVWVGGPQKVALHTRDAMQRLLIWSPCCRLPSACAVYCMCSGGKSPYPGLTSYQLVAQKMREAQQLAQGNLAGQLELPPGMPPSLQTFVRRCCCAVDQRCAVGAWASGTPAMCRHAGALILTCPAGGLLLTLVCPGYLKLQVECSGGGCLC